MFILQIPKNAFLTMQLFRTKSMIAAIKVEIVSNLQVDQQMFVNLGFY